MLFWFALSCLGLRAADTDNPPAPPSADSRIVRVGINPHAEPFSSLDEQGRPVGFGVDLFERIAALNGFQVKYVIGNWDDIFEQLKAGQIDVLPNISYRPERARFVGFTIPYAVLQGGAFVRKGFLVANDLADLRGRRISVGKGSITQDFCVRHQIDQNLVFATSLRQSLISVSEGRADVAMTAALVGNKEIEKLGLRDLVAVPLEMSELVFDTRMAVPAGRSDLLYDLNQGLYTLRQNGIYDALYEKWIGPIESRRPRWSDLQNYGVPVVIVLLFLGFALWRQRSLLKQLKQKTSALELSEERLTLVLEGSQDAFWDWDVPQGTVIRSQRWAEILGCALSDIPADLKGFHRLVHPDDLPLIHRTHELLLAEGHLRVEYRIQARNGTWRWIFDRGEVVGRDNHGRPIRVTGAATDVTARKETDEALARSQVLLEQTQQATEVGGWEYNVEKDTLYWTKQTFRIHDLDPTGAAPSFAHALEYFTPASQPVFRRAIERARNEGTPFAVELELITARSRLIWVRAVGRAERDGKKALRIYGSYQNITGHIKADEERQKLQLKMLEAQKLESLGVLAGGIAHDFNNLLTVILGNASMAREDPASAGDALKQIETASNRAADLCRQMLAYAGKSRFSLETLNLNAVVEDTVQLLRMSISKNATLEFELASQAVPVEADASQLRQVIMNLVINASDALAKTPGTIWVRTDIEHFTPETLRDARLGQELPAGQYVVLEVEDNGCGMSADTMSRIFDPFFTTKFTGRGLGLAAVLGIVRAHRGAFFVRSTLGKGSLFRMAIPFTQNPLPRASRPTKAAVPEPVGGAILVVDDEPSVRKFASGALERYGFTVFVASDGYEALALAHAHGGKYKAVLLDLTMPGLDGPATHRELRATISKTLPILIMSGYSEADVRKQFEKDPYVNFIPKPFTGEMLYAKLNSLLSEARSQTKARLPADAGAGL